MPATMTSKRQRRLGIPFKRLSKAAKERAIEKTIEYLNEDLDVRAITEMFEEFLAERGFPNMQVWWRLSSCQGDGVAFEGSLDIDEIAKHDEYVVEQLAKGVLLGIAGDDWCWSGGVKHSGQYYHCNSMDVELGWAAEADPELEAAANLIAIAIRDHIDEKIKSLSREMEALGYAEIEYQTSEEMALDMIEANDYRFDSDGDMV